MFSAQSKIVPTILVLSIFKTFNQYQKFLSNLKIGHYTDKKFKMDALHIFLPKQDSFQDSCINHLWCLRKSLFPLKLASFSKLNDLANHFFRKEVALITFSSPELTFFRNSADSVFSFWERRNLRKFLDFKSIPEIFIKLKDLVLYWS